MVRRSPPAKAVLVRRACESGGQLLLPRYEDSQRLGPRGQRRHYHFEVLYDDAAPDEIADGMRRLGLDASKVKDQIISHAHGDHDVRGWHLVLEEPCAAVVVAVGVGDDYVLDLAGAQAESSHPICDRRRAA